MRDSSPIDIHPDRWAIVRDILQRHVQRSAVWAFGSRARGTAKRYSDLDLAAITNEPFLVAVMVAFLDGLSESDLPWRADVVDWVVTGEPFLRVIEWVRVVVWGSPSDCGEVRGVESQVEA